MTKSQLPDVLAGVRRISVIKSEFNSFPPLALVYRDSPVPRLYDLDPTTEKVLRSACESVGGLRDYSSCAFVPGWDWDVTRLLSRSSVGNEVE